MSLHQSGEKEPPAAGTCCHDLRLLSLLCLLGHIRCCALSARLAARVNVTAGCGDCLMCDKTCGMQQLINHLTQQAVHSGADLDAAVRAVMGYDAVSMKGKKIQVEPVAAVATPDLGALLDAALEARAAVVRQRSGLSLASYTS